MNFNLNEAIEILERTPATLEQLLSGLSEGWLQCNEGDGTWNTYEVIDHLIECEKNNWIPRLESILNEGEPKQFPPFDRYAHLKNKTKLSIDQRLADIKAIRTQNISTIEELIDPNVHLEQKGLHPAFGAVKVRELLSTWAVHDLTHINQIVRIMAERYRLDVGPWQDYLGILKNNKK
ncbi:DinB family protein [Virgibacillus flavescens]|uniref:DinB family protein n=1 Tax=Virgibacillus flavescens TaxID=1611422 RepID=UPI003D356835